MRHPANATSQSFPRKLWEILENEDPEVVGWSDSGNSFAIRSMQLFIDEVLTKYFRHNKFSSFQRQLNLYGFKKVNKGPDSGAYSMRLFSRSRPNKLGEIKRSQQGGGSATGGKRRKGSMGSSEDDETETEDESEQQQTTRSLFGDCLSRRPRSQSREPTPPPAKRRAPPVFTGRPTPTPADRMKTYCAFDHQFLQRAGGVPSVVRGDSLSSNYLDKKLQELSQGHPYSQQQGGAFALPGRLSRSSSSASQKSLLETAMDMDNFTNEFTNRASLGNGGEAVAVAVSVPDATDGSGIAPPYAGLPTATAVPAGLNRPPFNPPPSVSRSNSMQEIGSLDDIDFIKTLRDDNLDAFWGPEKQEEEETAVRAPAPSVPAPVPAPAPAPVAAPITATAYDPMMGAVPSLAVTLSR